MARAVTGTLAVFLAVSPSRAGTAAEWIVRIDGRDHTRAADPIEVDGEVLVDLVSLGPALGLQVRLSPAPTIVDSTGVRWESVPGGDLVRRGEMLLLGNQRRTATSWHVAARVAARLSGRAVIVERAEPGTASGGSGGRDSWESFTLAKTPEELAAAARFAAGHERPAPAHEQAIPPPARQRMRATVGIGYRDGGEVGAEIAAHGSWSDWNVQLHGAAAWGPAGSGSEGYLFAETPGQRWNVEAGNLYSEAAGTLRGVRVARVGARHRSAFSVYLPDSRSTDREPVAAYRDLLSIGSAMTVGGEVTSDGRWALTSSVRRGWFAGSVHARDGGGGTAARGASLFVESGGVGISGSYYQSDDAGRRFETQNLQLRLPTRGRLDTALEAWGSQSATSSSWARAAVMSLPVGQTTVRVRYAVRSTEWTAAGRATQGREDQEVQALLASRSTGRARFDVQWVSAWPEDGEVYHRAGVNASYRFASGTSLQVFGSLTSLDQLPERYLIRLTQELPREYLVSLELGDVVGFPVGQNLLPEGAEPGRVKIAVRRSFDLATPAGGGVVAGRVLSPGSIPVADVPVRLGTYLAFTDAGGRYLFNRVPAGSYDLGLEAEGLPVHLQPNGPPLAIDVRRGERQDHDLLVAPLATVRGRVYLDRDRDGRIGAGEGIGGIVLTLDEEATASARDGSFAFHNLSAGQYEVQVVTDRLPKDLVAAVPFRFDLGLAAGKSVDLVLRLLPAERPIAFQDLP